MVWVLTSPWLTPSSSGSKHEAWLQTAQIYFGRAGSGKDYFLQHSQQFSDQYFRQWCHNSRCIDHSLFLVPAPVYLAFLDTIPAVLYPKQREMLLTLSTLNKFILWKLSGVWIHIARNTLQSMDVDGLSNCTRVANLNTIALCRKFSIHSAPLDQ